MWPEYRIQLGGGSVRWVGEYDDTCRLMVDGPDGRLLALEGEQSGLWAHFDGDSVRLPMKVAPDTLQTGKTHLKWRQRYFKYGFSVAAEFRRIGSDCLGFVYRITAIRDLASFHYGWGISLNLGATVNRYAFTQSPTQMGYSFEDSKTTLWVISAHNNRKLIKKFSGCQALVAENPDPTSLEFHLRVPPGFVEKPSLNHVLQAGETAVLQGIIGVRPGFFYEHVESNEKLQPLKAHPARYPYRRYIDMAVRQFHDPRKYHPEHKGILYYTAVDGACENPRIQYWTEGPGWGGGCDAENAYNTVLYAKEFLKGRKQAEFLNHARSMLDGWIDNPKFRVPQGTSFKESGDMSEAILCTGWFPDCIWTGGQADFILRLSDIHALTGWEDCLTVAKDLGRWVLRNQSPDGSIPTLWQFPIEYPKELPGEWRPEFSLCRRQTKQAEVLVDCQPATACFLVVALFHLHAVDSHGPWRRAALRLLKWALRHLEAPLAAFGNGEFDYLVFRARSMDPTGLSYILWGLAEGYEQTKEPCCLRLLRRYMNTLLAFGVTYDFRETLLRPREKVTLPPYGTDIKLAGGITHANWMPIFKRGFGGRFNLLMNRNEMGEGMFHAWKVTKDHRFRNWLTAYANWQTYFQFTKEVKNGLVLTKGACPQNHFWTTDRGNWNNDFALTAHKWVGTYMRLMKAGITGEKRTKRKF